jgi:DNA processing protein
LAAAGWWCPGPRADHGAAHQGALVAGSGKGGTIAVVAGGVDNIYPQENAALRERILETGLVVSEMPPGFKPRDIHFPRRNRIISGLSKGVVVVEAALAPLAHYRPMAGSRGAVMAVPGSLLDPRCRGTNRLIREGAASLRMRSRFWKSNRSAPPIIEVDQP